jgi:3-oxoacyl-[acyl-carrier protein] reductase
MILKGKICLITGAAAGIGKATAQRFAEEGAKVVLWDLIEDQGNVVAKTVNGRFNKVDVTNRQEVQLAAEEIIAEYGRIDVLINNAGVLRDGQLVKVKDGELVAQMSEEDFDLVVNVNLKGVFNCTQSVAPYMIKQHDGVILNATSVVGLDGNFGQTNYVATKAGVVGMTKVWARELGRFNIRVNAIAPGFILTDMVRQMPEKVLEGMVSRTPLKRPGKPRDVANAYLFLASDEAAFITGATLRVDGGIVIGT